MVTHEYEQSYRSGCDSRILRERMWFRIGICAQRTRLVRGADESVSQRPLSDVYWPHHDASHPWTVYSRCLCGDASWTRAGPPSAGSSDEEGRRELMRDPAKRAAFMGEHFTEPVFDKAATTSDWGVAKPGG